MNRSAISRLGMLVALSLFPTFSAGAETSVEVLHWWVSPSDAKAVAAMKTAYAGAGGRWIDLPTAQGDVDKVLADRVKAGNPPGAVMMQYGRPLQKWLDQGALADVDAVARAEHWDAVLPRGVADWVKRDGKYFAVPVNVQRLNTLFVNRAVLRKAGIKVGPDWPKNWDEFNAVAEKIQKAGVVPLAHGGQPWQDAMLFSAAVLGVGGRDFYKKVLIDFDADALAGPTMIKVFDQMRRLKGFTSKNGAGSTEQVVSGEAAMQISGDWAKGVFTDHGKKPGKDFLCLPAPSGGPAFLGNSDVFGLFKLQDGGLTPGQALAARVAMSPDVQLRFNAVKGSIPARLDVPREKFDACARRTMDDLAAASAHDSIVPLGSAQTAAKADALHDAVTRHFNSEMSSEDAVKALVEAVRLAK
jgi:glucose/mannose transport system substrate-binding protein